MKKLLTIAIMALTALMGQAASECNVCSAGPTDTAWVYKWQFKGKTTAGKVVKNTGNACSPGEECTIRCPTSLKIQGYTWAISNECGTSVFSSFSETEEVFWCTKPSRASLAGGINTEICNIIDKKKKKCEVGGTATFDAVIDNSGTIATYTITYAGFGKYDVKNGRVTSASGNFAGFLSEPRCMSNCSTAGIWDCSTLALICDVTPTVVFGKWSVKYKKSASKKYKNDDSMKLSIPSWVTYENR